MIRQWERISKLKPEITPEMVEKIALASADSMCCRKNRLRIREILINESAWGKMTCLFRATSQ